MAKRANVSLKYILTVVIFLYATTQLLSISLWSQDLRRRHLLFLVYTDIELSRWRVGQPRWLSGLRRSRVHSLWLLVDHCVLRNWDRILVRAVKGLISRAGMVSICPLLWQRDVKLQQTNKQTRWRVETRWVLRRTHSSAKDRIQTNGVIGCASWNRLRGVPVSLAAA